jgi:3-oxoacyl-[acyl-carrier protein] reductase
MKMQPETSQRLRGKVAVVTGGGGANSIGRAICLRLAEEGARVAVLDVNAVGASAVAEEIVASGGIAIPVACDITHLEQCLAAAKQVADTWSGRIEILVNNAAFFGTMGAWRPFNEWTVEEWDKMQAVNVRGMWFCAQAVFPYMKAQGYGKLVNISSDTAFAGLAGNIHYVSSKGGVIAFTRALAREIGQFGIRVNSVAPGFTDTDANVSNIGRDSEWYEVARSQQCLTERNEVPEDLAGPVFFLACEDSDFITGQSLVVNGGSILH